MSCHSRLVLLALAVVPFACGGFSSGLPGNTKASDLSSAQRQQYCDALADFHEREMGERWTEFTCQLSGAMAGQLSEAFTPGSGRQACEDAAQSCREDDGGDETSDTGNECSFEGCTATVAELERCHAAQVAQFRKLIEESTASCDPATWSDDEENGFDFETPEECEGLIEACVDR